MYRSASTLQFNILRIILDEYYGEVYSSFVDDYDPNNESEIHLVKLHNPDYGLSLKANKIFTSIRDKVSIIESIKRRQKYNDILSPDYIDSYLALWQFWAFKADFIQSYPMIDDMDKLIKLYIILLDTPVLHYSVTQRLKDEMQIPDKDQIGHDKKTLLHYGHITTEE